MSNMTTNYQDNESGRRIEITNHISKAKTHEAMGKSPALGRLLHDRIDNMSNYTGAKEQSSLNWSYQSDNISMSEFSWLEFHHIVFKSNVQ